MKKLKKSVFIPGMLLIYLVVMAVMGINILKEGEYLQYFGIIIVSLLCIAALHYTLRLQERARARRREEVRELEKKAAEQKQPAEEEPTAEKED